MSIPISSNFDLYTAKPLDERLVQATNTTRDAIPAEKRHVGMRVYVSDSGKSYQLLGGILNANWIEVVTVPANGILSWGSNTYAPYSSATTGAFDNGIVAPSGTTRLNYGGYLYATRLYDNNTRVSTTDHAHAATYEAVLGNPSATGKVLTSTTGGVRSWATPIPSLVPIATINSLGVIKVGAYLTIDANGVLNGQAGGTGGGGVWGTITGTLGSQTDLSEAMALKAPLLSPSFTTPDLGTPSAGTLTNCTFPTLNQNTTGTAAKASSAVAGFAISGGALTLDNNDITGVKELGLTGARVTKGWFADITCTNAISANITGVASGIGPEASNTFSMIAAGATLNIKYGSTVIATISSTGIIQAKNELTAFATL